MKKILAITIIAFSIFSGINAQSVHDQLNPLITGVPFLTIAPDARAGGMGDLGAATTPDVASQYWNPAKYAFMESEAGMSFSFTPWLSKLVSDINLSNLVGYWRFEDRQTISASLRYFSLGKVDLQERPGDPILSAYPSDFAVDVAYTLLLAENLSGSVALRYIWSNLGALNREDMHPGSSFAADVALYYRKPIEFASGDGNWGLGLNISNIGSKITYDDEARHFIPTNLRLGTSFDYPINSYNRISASVDLNKLLVPTRPRDVNELQDYYDMSPIAGIFKSFGDAPRGFKEEMEEIMWSVGAEYAYNNQFFVRAGYFNEHMNKGNRKFFTAGAGFKLTAFQLDVAYVISSAQTNPLDGTLRFGLSFDIFGLKDLVN